MGKKGLLKIFFYVLNLRMPGSVMLTSILIRNEMSVWMDNIDI
jgi:hypothetical protein